jgi:hypothetical protein
MEQTPEEFCENPEITYESLKLHFLLKTSRRLKYFNRGGKNAFMCLCENKSITRDLFMFALEHGGNMRATHDRKTPTYYLCRNPTIIADIGFYYVHFVEIHLTRNGLLAIILENLDKKNIRHLSQRMELTGVFHIFLHKNINRKIARELLHKIPPDLISGKNMLVPINGGRKSVPILHFTQKTIKFTKYKKYNVFITPQAYTRVLIYLQHHTNHISEDYWYMFYVFGQVQINPQNIKFANSQFKSLILHLTYHTRRYINRYLWFKIFTRALNI